MKKRTGRDKSVIEKNAVPVTGKIPPQNTDAEQSLLGSVLQTNKVFDKVAHIVMPEDFYDPRNRRIFSAMKDINTKNAAIDLLTVTAELKDKGLLEEAGGASYVTALPENVPTAAHAEEYARIVREKAVLRNLIDFSVGITEASFSEENPPDAILEDAERIIFEIRQREQTGAVKKVKDMIFDVYERMKELGRGKDAHVGIETGYKKIDDFTSGLQPSELIIIAARPSLGKTSLAMNIAYRAAVDRDKCVLIFSLEMTAEDLIRRFLAIGSRVDLQKIRTGKFITMEEDAGLVRVAGELSNASIFIDTDDNGVFEMRAKARNLMSELRRENKKLDLIIVDYMQLVKPNESMPREQQIAQISRSLKALAREMNVPVVALSQLNRESEKREVSKFKGGPVSSTPKLSDLRESGAIEQDADVVMFIAREGKEEGVSTETYDTGATFSRKTIKCKLMIEKNRNGPTGEQQVWFIPALTVFEQVSGMTTDEDVGGNAGVI
ncbi:MAG TPA: replicative DNA helicase [bacterium]|mgnify:CR=1 FL=1|nr:replicative DNA helicase [bacterium]